MIAGGALPLGTGELSGQAEDWLRRCFFPRIGMHAVGSVYGCGCQAQQEGKAHVRTFYTCGGFK